MKTDVVKFLTEFGINFDKIIIVDSPIFYWNMYKNCVQDFDECSTIKMWVKSHRILGDYFSENVIKNINNSDGIIVKSVIEYETHILNGISINVPILRFTFVPPFTDKYIFNK